MLPLDSIGVPEILIYLLPCNNREIPFFKGVTMNLELYQSIVEPRRQ
jgi:hypothetical protein